MFKTLSKLLLSGLAWLALISGSTAMAEPDEENYRRLASQMVPMRDGVELSTDFYFPKSFEGELPLILIRTVYGKEQLIHWNPAWKELISQGYVIAIQDIRGRFESGGDYQIITGRREDGSDTLDWIARQPWSNGKVALGGCSYQGEAQVVLAATNHPALVTAVPMWPGSGYYVPGRAWQSFSGGAFELGQTAGWFAGSGSTVYTQPPEGADRGEFFKEFGGKIEMTPPVDFARYLEELKTLPTIDTLQRAGVPPTHYETWRRSHPDGEFFRNSDLVKQDDSVSIPALFMDSWYDYGATETLEMFANFSANANTPEGKRHQYLVIGPGTHCSFDGATTSTVVGARPVGDARYPYLQLQLDWYNYWMKGEKNGVLERDKIHYFQLGDNQWKSTNQWPPEGVEPERWYLSSSKGANSLEGDGRLDREPAKQQGEDHIRYDPGNPAPSLGGHTCCTGTDTEAGGYDQRDIESRDDVLVYTSDILEQNVEMVGRIHARLHVSSSAKDTDFTAKLVDVQPDGTAYNVQEGVLRMRYRNSLRKPEAVVPGEVYAIDIDLHTTANTFKAGHRIRLEISSSNYPRIERNLNTGGNNYDETEYVIANNRVFLGGEYDSYIELPVMR